MAGSSRQTFNFVLHWEHQEPRLFMVPVRWKEGKKREGGPALELRLWNYGAEGSSSDFHNSPRSSWECTHHHYCFLSRVLRKGAEARQARKSKWIFCFIFGKRSFNSLIHSKEQTGSRSWRGPWREKQRGSWGGLEGSLLQWVEGSTKEVLLSLWCYIVFLFLGLLASLLSCSTLFMLAPEGKN